MQSKYSETSVSCLLEMSVLQASRKHEAHTNAAVSVWHELKAFIFKKTPL